MVRWTLITVTYNNSQTLRDFWSGPIPTWVEWIVVDNASSDDSASVAARIGAHEVLALEKNVGFGAANNIGFARAKGDYVAFVNPDVTVDFESLEELALSIESRGGLVSPQLLNPDGSLQPNGRGLPTLLTKIRNRLPKKFQANGYNIFAEKGDEREVDWFIGAAVTAKKSTFEMLSGWDERFFIYYEDADIGLRAWKEGLSVRVVGNAQWVHGWARETTGFKVEPWKREFASMAKFYARYPVLLGPISLARRVFLRPRVEELPPAKITLQGETAEQ